MKKQIRISIVSIFILTLIFGLAYPLLIWGLGALFYPHHANGALIERSGVIVGSKYIGQNFSDPKYFHGRPSDAGKNGYDAMKSGASNLGPTSAELIKILEERIQNYRLENHLPPTIKIPSDAVTSSGSGLDPHISLDNADLQAERVAATRNLPIATVKKAIRQSSSKRSFGIFGEPRVNVLMLNMALDSGIQ